MPLFAIIEVFLVVAVLLGLINYVASKFPQFISGQVIQILNAVVCIALILWVLFMFLPLGNIGNIRVGHP